MQSRFIAIAALTILTLAATGCDDGDGAREEGEVGAASAQSAEKSQPASPSIPVDPVEPRPKTLEPQGLEKPLDLGSQAKVESASPSGDATVDLVTAPCGSRSVESGLSDGTAEGAPLLSAGAIAGGALDRNLSEAAFFVLDLPAGKSAIVLDVSTPGERATNLLARLSLVDTNGSLVETLLHVNAVDWRTRRVVEVSRAKATSAIVRLESEDGRLDYQLAHFASGMAIPTPYFVNCPKIVSAGTDAPLELVLDRSEPELREIWLSIDDGAITSIEADTAALDPSHGNIGIDLELRTGFADAAAGRRILRQNSRKKHTVDMADLPLDAKRPAMIRVTPSFDDARSTLRLFSPELSQVREP